MKIDIVNPAEWIPNIKELLIDNWSETGFDFDFDPDIDLYRKLFEIGLMFAVRAHKENETIGYCTVSIAPHLHNKKIIVAANDAIFVRKDCRGGIAAYKIIRAAEEEAKRKGAVRFAWHCRDGTNLLRMLEKRGYKPVDNIVLRSI